MIFLVMLFRFIDCSLDQIEAERNYVVQLLSEESVPGRGVLGLLGQSSITCSVICR